MKKTIFIIAFIIVTAFTTSKSGTENLRLSYQLTRPKLKEAIQSEKNKNSTEHKYDYTISLSEEYFPEIDKYDFAQPIIYRRKIKALNTQVSYFFTKQDSIVRLIEYSWDEKVNTDSIANLFKYNDKVFTKSFKKAGNINNNTFDWGWQKITSWENDSVYVYQFMFGKEKPARTRVIVRYK